MCEITYEDNFFRIDGKLIPIAINNIHRVNYSIDAYWLRQS